MVGICDPGADNTSLMWKESPRAEPLSCGASAPQEEENRTDDGHDCNSSGDDSADSGT